MLSRILCSSLRSVRMSAYASVHKRRVPVSSAIDMRRRAYGTNEALFLLHHPTDLSKRRRSVPDSVAGLNELLDERYAEYRHANMLLNRGQLPPGDARALSDEQRRLPLEDLLVLGYHNQRERLEEIELLRKRRDELLAEESELLAEESDDARNVAARDDGSDQDENDDDDMYVDSDESDSDADDARRASASAAPEAATTTSATTTTTARSGVDETFVDEVADSRDVFNSANVLRLVSVRDDALERVLPEGFAEPLADTFEDLRQHTLLVRDTVVRLIERIESLRSGQFAPHSDTIDAHTVVDGLRGVGKSAVLAQLVLYARRSGWICWYVRDANQLLSGGRIVRPSMRGDGLCDENTTAQRLLSELNAAHGEQLAELPLQLAPNVQEYKASAGDTCATLLRHGLDTLSAASDVALHLRHELAGTTRFPVLFVVDNAPALALPSKRYHDMDSDRFKAPRADADKFTLASMFREAHRHGMANGTVVSATSANLRSEPFFRLLSMRPPHEMDEWDADRALVHTVPPYTFEEYRHIMHLYETTDFVRVHLNSQELEYVYAMCGGRAHEVHQFSGII